MVVLSDEDKNNIENGNIENLIQEWKIENNCDVRAIIFDDSRKFYDNNDYRFAVGKIEINHDAKTLMFNGFLTCDVNETSPIFIPLNQVELFKIVSY